MIIQENNIDIYEDDILTLGKGVLDDLLKDRTTRKNIIWATTDYEKYGIDYLSAKEISIPLITGRNSKIIQPRIAKEKNHQLARTKIKAEVFTPAWVCNEQNNLIDEQWFGRPNVFNASQNKKWITNLSRIEFPTAKGKGWKAYIDARRMEISCGEAPYLVSRYDTVTGSVIPLQDRIGFLDRKFRIVNENVDNETDWNKWAIRALQSIYGYEYQGDNLLLARENIILTFIENSIYKFNKIPDTKMLHDAAKIISWNIWQMDGLTFAVPLGKRQEYNQQLLLDDILFAQIAGPNHSQLFCKIMDWRNKNSLLYKDLVTGGRK